MISDSVKASLLKGDLFGGENPFKQEGQTIRLNADSVQITKVGDGLLRIGHFWRGKEMMWSTCEIPQHGQVLTIEFKPEVSIS